MRALQLIRRQHSNALQADRYESDFAETRPRNGETPFRREFRMPGTPVSNRDDARGPCGTEGFFKDLPAEAQRDFASLATHFRCPGSTVLISEAQEPSRILFLLEGEVNISMNSSDGKRLLLEVAGAGDTLGLTSALSGDSSEIRAQSMYPCRIASLQRRDFLGFISRHPVAGSMPRANYAPILRGHARDCASSCLTSTATARLALLLLEMVQRGPTDTGRDPDPVCADAPRNRRVHRRITRNGQSYPD